MFTSPFPAVEIPRISMYDYLFGDLTDDDATRVAMIDGSTGASLTYGELRDCILALAGALSARGIGASSVVAMICPNSPAFAIVFHGILRDGAAVTTLNPVSTSYEIERQLRASGTEWVFTVSPILENVLAGTRPLGIPDSRVVVLDGAPGHLSLNDLVNEGSQPREVHFDPTLKVAVLPYSSGTTGMPKGVKLSHTNLIANVAQITGALRVDPDDRVLAVLPFFHIYGMTVLLNLALRRRSTLVTMPRFDLAEFLRIIDEYALTYLFIAPPVAVALAKHPMVEQYNISSVHTVLSGAAPLDGNLAQAVAARLHCDVLQGYGMTEASPVTHLIPRGRDDLPRDSVGLTLPNVECKIIDLETHEDLPVPTEGISARGELLVRGPNVMLGYLDNDLATAATVDREGWLHTGDIATVGADGTVTVVDRLKELIKYKGYQVAPAELELLLLTHPSIADAAVIGVVRDGEEIPKGFIVPQPGSGLTPAQVEEFVNQRVSPYKRLREIEFIDVVPKSTSGKILRKDLRMREAEAPAR